MSETVSKWKGRFNRLVGRRTQAQAPAAAVAPPSGYATGASQIGSLSTAVDPQIKAEFLRTGQVDRAAFAQIRQATHEGSSPPAASADKPSPSAAPAEILSARPRMPPRPARNAPPAPTPAEAGSTHNPSPKRAPASHKGKEPDDSDDDAPGTAAEAQSSEGAAPPPDYKPIHVLKDLDPGTYVSAHAAEQLTRAWMADNVSPKLQPGIAAAMAALEHARTAEDKRPHVGQTLEGPALEELIRTLNQAQKKSVPGLQAKSRTSLDQMLSAAQQRLTDHRQAAQNTVRHADQILAALESLLAQAEPTIDELNKAIQQVQAKPAEHFQNKIQTLTDLLERTTAPNFATVKTLNLEMTSNPKTVYHEVSGPLKTGIDGLLHLLSRTIDELRKKDYASAAKRLDQISTELAGLARLKGKF